MILAHTTNVYLSCCADKWPSTTRWTPLQRLAIRVEGWSVGPGLVLRYLPATPRRHLLAKTGRNDVAGLRRRAMGTMRLVGAPGRVRRTSRAVLAALAAVIATAVLPGASSAATLPPSSVTLTLDRESATVGENVTATATADQPLPNYSYGIDIVNADTGSSLISMCTGA